MNRLCNEVRGYAGELVDGFGIPDAVLAAPIGLSEPKRHELPHPRQPALGLGALERVVLRDVLVREDEEALLADAVDHRLGDVGRLHQVVLEQRRGARALLVERLLEHRRAHAERAQAGHLQAGVGVHDRQPLGRGHRRVLGDAVGHRADLGEQAGGRRGAEQVALAALGHRRHAAPGRPRCAPSR